MLMKLKKYIKKNIAQRKKVKFCILQHLLKEVSIDCEIRIIMRDVKDTIFTTGCKIILNELENRKL